VWQEKHAAVLVSDLYFVRRTLGRSVDKMAVSRAAEKGTRLRLPIPAPSLLDPGQSRDPACSPLSVGRDSYAQVECTWYRDAVFTLICLGLPVEGLIPRT
jgi:hypothetical protein